MSPLLSSPSSPPYRSSWRRMAVSSIFWLGLTALSVLFLAALGVMTTVVG